jgi:site-specific DNA recombinase
MSDQKLCLGYSRVSSEEQAAHGISIDAQRNILEGYAAMTSQQIRIYEDAGYSGKNTNRPALQQLLTACRAGSVSAVVVWKLDRLSRSLRDTLTIIEDVFQPAGITLVSVTESIDTSTPSGRMMLNLLASFAQLEREQDSDRVVMAHKHLARDCKYLGGHVPLGYCIDSEKHYQLDPVTAPVVRRVFEMYLSRSGYTPILEYLNSFAFPGTRKTPFGKSDLKNLLQNEIYAGTYVRRMGADPRHRITSPETIRVPGGVPALLTPDEWQRVCALRSQSERASAIYSARRVYPLSGLVYCASCGALMPLNYGGKDRDGSVQRYYTCKAKCARPARLEHIQDAVFAVVEQMAVAGSDAIAAACGIANSYADAADEDHAAEARAVDQQVLEINKKISRIIAFITEHGSAAPASLADDLTRLEKDRDVLQARAASLRKPASRYDTAATVAAIASCAGIKKQPPDQQKALLQAAVYKVLVSADDYKIIFNWHTGGGDEPPHPVCQSYQRKA